MQAHEDRRLQTRLKVYAFTAAFASRTPSEIQADLLGIAGEPHAYRRSIGTTACILCGQSKKSAVHRSNSGPHALRG